jgi:hypothetical protein
MLIWMPDANDADPVRVRRLTRLIVITFVVQIGLSALHFAQRPTRPRRRSRSSSQLLPAEAASLGRHFGIKSGIGIALGS